MNLIEFINSLVPLSEESANFIFSRISKKTLPKNTRIHNANEVCDAVFFIERGLIRWFYYNENGKDVTDSFALENSFVTAFDSFFQRRPSRYFIETLEETTVYSMSYRDVEEEISRFPETQRLTNVILVQILEQMLEKNSALQFKNAQERYFFIKEKHPEILRRAPLGHIASYLGITQETLSRIRKQKL